MDDSADDVELLRIAMRRCGSPLEVVAAMSGEEAIRRIADAAGRPDVVLLDWKMPGTSGADVLRAIRQDPSTRDVPVFVCSATDSPIDIRTAHELGASGFLPKPADMGEYVRLARELAAALGRPVPARP